jgi:predicted PurR-regulated permease PerM
MLVIFLGAIGGFISFGFLGLFIGAVILSVGYKVVRGLVAGGYAIFAGGRGARTG